MEEKSSLYIVAIVGVVAVVALVIMILGVGTRQSVVTVQNPASTADATGQAMALTPCESHCGGYDGVLSQQPCVCRNPIA